MVGGLNLPQKQVPGDSAGVSRRSRVRVALYRDTPHTNIEHTQSMQSKTYCRQYQRHQEAKSASGYYK